MDDGDGEHERGTRPYHVIVAVAIAATVGTSGGCGYRLSPPSVTATAAFVFDTRLQHVSASDKDGARDGWEGGGGEIRDAVPCEFWHGSRKLLTLAAFRGKLAEFST